MSDRGSQLDLALLMTMDRCPSQENIAALLNNIASHRTPSALVDEWPGYLIAYRNLVGRFPKLVPHLIPLLLEIADNPDYRGKWWAISLVMVTNETDWGDVFRDGELGQQIRSAFVAGVPVYLRHLVDPDPMTRTAVACALGESGSPEALAALTERLPQEADAEVQRWIRISLAGSRFNRI